MLRQIFGLMVTVSFGVMIRISGSALNFLANVYLARTLGPAEFGIFTLSIAWLYILVIGARLGFDQSPTPILASMRGRGVEWEIGPFMSFSVKWVAGISVIVAMLGMAIVKLASNWVPDGIENVLPLVFAMLPTLAMAQFMESTFRGLGRVQFAWIPMSLIQPAALLAGVLVAVELLHLKATGYLAAAAFLASLAVALAALSTEWVREFLRRRSDRFGVDRRAQWLRISASMVVGGSFSVLVNQTTTVLTGISETVDAGLFGAATRIANVVGMISGTLFGVIGNRLAESHARGDTRHFRHLLLSAGGMIAAVSIPAFIIGAVFPRELLGIMGPEFAGAARCLVILLAYQGALGAANLATLALNMIGRHVSVARLLVGHIVANFILSGALIYWAGVDGAALALLVIALSIGLCAWYQLIQALRAETKRQSAHDGS